MIELSVGDRYYSPAGIIENGDGTFEAYIKLAQVDGHDVLVRSTHKLKGRACNSVIKKMQALTSLFNEMLADTLYPVYLQENEEALKDLAKKLGIDEDKEIKKLLGDKGDN